MDTIDVFNEVSHETPAHELLSHMRISDIVQLHQNDVPFKEDFVLKNLRNFTHIELLSLQKVERFTSIIEEFLSQQYFVIVDNPDDLLTTNAKFVKYTNNFLNLSDKDLTFFPEVITTLTNLVTFVL
jgi:hypothetical protein